MIENVNPTMSKSDTLLFELGSLIVKMRKAKPLDRTEAARRYAVTITELEKAFAYFRTYVAEADDNGDLSG